MEDNQKNAAEERGPGGIDVGGLLFGYRDFPVLNGVSFKIDGPKLVSIIGPNGVGKSTLVQCINKILKPDGGSVVIDGKDVSEFTLRDLSKKVGYVPCSTVTTFPITVADAVKMGRHPYSKRGSLDRDLRIVFETLEKLGISDLAMRPINELSAGQLQKVILAKGLAQQPEILLLDEPTANLDIKHQMYVARLLRGIAHEEGVTVVMICHDLNMAAKYSDEILMMYEGGIYADGTPEEVITPENIKTVYGVDAEVITHRGRPHILLLDDQDADIRYEAREGDMRP